MNIERINTYQDSRFSQKVLCQHGCFLVDGAPYEVEILSQREAVVRGREEQACLDVIEEFRFFAPHITTFYKEDGNLIKRFPPVPLLTVSIKEIQPSQFYVDEEKIAAVREFIQSPEDIIIQVIRHGDRYISLDGHTRLYFAAVNGWETIRAVEEPSENYIYGFVEEAVRRGIHSPYNLQLVSHEEYEIKWNRFCDDYFTKNQ